MLRRLSAPLLGALLILLVPTAAARAADATVCAPGAPLGAAQGYTEFVLGNGQRGSESEGAIAYGGDLAANGMTVGTRLSVATSFPSLVVNGTGGSFNLQAGSAYVRSLTGYVNYNGGGRRLADPPIDMAAAFTDLRARSAAWTAAPATGTADVVDSQTTGTALGGNVLWLRGTDAQRNVFHVTPAQLRNIRATFIDVPAGATALIDVSGTDVTIDGEVRYRSGSTFRQADDTPVADAVKRTVWNLSDATSVTLNTGSAFGGTILAPGAAVYAQNVGHNNGQVIAASFRSNYETHQYLVPTDACLPPVTPTPPVDPPVDPPTPGIPELHVAKVADHSSIAPGGAVTFTLSVTNSGTADAHDVVLSDMVPVGLNVSGAGAGCTVAGVTVRCDAGTVAAGQTKTFTVTTTAASVAAPSASSDDQIAVSKAEQQISLPANTTQTFRAQCQPGDVAADGAVRVDGVDQGTGDRGSVEVQRLRTLTDGSGYEAVVANHASGQAQAKLFIVCLPPATTGGHALLFGDPVAKTQTLTTGRHSVVFDCGTGRTPVAPSIDVTAGAATVAASVPSGTTGRRIDLDVAAGGATVTAGVRCLSELTGVANGTTTRLVWTPIEKAVSVPAGAVTTEQLVCGDQAKGIVGGWTYEDGLLPLGNEPQPKTRVFTLWNPTGGTRTGTIHLLCLDVRTGAPASVSDVTNTVTGTSSSAQAAGAILSAGATVRISSGPDAGAPPTATVDPPATGPATATDTSSTSRIATPDTTPRTVRATVAATATSATVRSASLRIGVACTGTCAGTVDVRLRATVKAGGHTYRKGTRIGHARFSRTGAVTVRLPKALAKKLRRTRVSVVVTSGGTTRTATVRALG